MQTDNLVFMKKRKLQDTFIKAPLNKSWILLVIAKFIVHFGTAEHIVGKGVKKKS